MAIGEHHGVGGDDPTVEGIVAHEPEVQMDTGDLAGKVLELALVVRGGRVVDAHRTNDMERAASLAEPAKCLDGAIESLVGLDETNAQKDVVIHGEAEQRPCRSRGHPPPGG